MEYAMKNIKIIKFDEYRYRIQTHNDGIYDMSNPMVAREILDTLKRLLQELGMIVRMPYLYPERDFSSVCDEYNETRRARIEFVNSLQEVK